MDGWAVGMLSVSEGQEGTRLRMQECMLGIGLENVTVGGKWVNWLWITSGFGGQQGLPVATIRWLQLRRGDS